MILNFNLNFISRKTLVVIVIIAILLAGNIVFGVRYLWDSHENQLLQKQLSTQQTNEKISSFLSLFIKKVLKAQGEVSFEDRLQLENAIRSINDKELLALWDKFTQSTSADQVQQNVKNLLESLASKIVAN